MSSQHLSFEPLRDNLAMNLGARVKLLRTKAGLSQAELGKLAGMTQVAIGLLELRDSKSSRSTTKLAQALKTTVEFLETGKEPQNETTNYPKAAQDIADYNVREADIAAHKVPLISWVAAGEWCETIDPYPIGAAEKTFPAPANAGKRTYALRVEGESMSRLEQPAFYDGEIIFVDPGKDPVNKSFVIVRLEDENKSTFKQLIIEGERRYLMALNPGWPNRIIEVNENAHICGVVIGKYVETV